jgi:beta-glucosidase
LQAMMKFMPLRALVAFNPDNFNDDMLNTLLKQLNDTLDNVKEEITSN